MATKVDGRKTNKTNYKASIKDKLLAPIVAYFVFILLGWSILNMDIAAFLFFLMGILFVIQSFDISHKDNLFFRLYNFAFGVFGIAAFINRFFIQPGLQ